MEERKLATKNASFSRWTRALAILVLLLSSAITGVHQSLEEADIAAVAGAALFPIVASLLVLAVAQIWRSQRTTAARWRTLLYTGILLLILSAGMLAEALATAN